MYLVGITGASGSILGVRIVEELLRSGYKVGVIVSNSGWEVLNHEVVQSKDKLVSFVDLLLLRGLKFDKTLLVEYDNSNFFSPPASGSGNWNSIVIAPTSMKTLSAIANGYSDSLITRAADVALKEGRTCILLPRETPLSEIHLNNMLKIKKAGGDILPPVMGFYSFPESVNDMVDFVVAKVLNILGVEHNLLNNWGE